MVGFNPSNLKNFKDEPWSHYGREFEHLLIDIDDVDDANLLIELPRAVRFIHQGLQQAISPQRAATGKSVARVSEDEEEKEEARGFAGSSSNVAEAEPSSPSASRKGKGAAVFVHCAAGKSRSAAVVVAYLLWRRPTLFDPNVVGSPDGEAAGSQPPSGTDRPRRETANEAVRAAVAFVRRTRPMVEPNDGFMRQLELWWEIGCPVDKDIETFSAYQRWAYQREVEENLAAGQAPSRLRFEDEENTDAASGQSSADGSGLTLKCKKCRRALATGPFVIDHEPQQGMSAGGKSQCQHFFIEPLGWMRGELEKGELNGRLLCPTQRCGAAVGRYDWKGFKCSCGGWVTPAFSLQRSRVDDMILQKPPAVAGADHNASRQQSLGIRLPPGMRNGNL